MKKIPFISLLFLALSVLLYLFFDSSFIKRSDSGIPAIKASENLPGGEGSVSFSPVASFMEPMANLPENFRSDFAAGKALAHQPWVKAPTITFSRDGLGPVYNARTCLMCHINGGRGLMPSNEKQGLNTALLRLSLPGKNSIHGVIPEPVYGDQLQTQSISLKHQMRHLNNPELKHSVPPEAYLYIQWRYQNFAYPDGSEIRLRSPEIKLENFGYGPLHPETLTSLRNAPPLLGVGLLEQIPQDAIEALADEDDQNGDGISGRPNRVWDYETEKTVMGRFGLKANKGSVRLQTAAAFHSDVGISNEIFPDQPCTKRQAACLQQPDGRDKEGTELSKDQLLTVVNFTKSLAVPKRREATDETVLAGRRFFHQIGCANCHHPSYRTKKSTEFPHLSEQTIWPYSDLLLHDMGPKLADGRPDYLANGSEWRTPPLWGIGLSKKVNGAQNFLHDGRARTVEEAILWHGGEAEAAMQAFSRLSREERSSLIKFVNSL